MVELCFFLPRLSRINRPRKRTTGAAIALVQEARGLDENPVIKEKFLPPFSGKDEYTAVLIRSGTFDEVENVSEAVHSEISKALQKRLPDASAEISKAWTTTANRIAAVTCTANKVAQSGRQAERSC